MTEEVAMFARLTNRFALWREYRNTLFELSLLDDQILKDNGIARCDIRRRAKGALPERAR
jgi:uncharacterized protein YjiS (DUF1127 family)